LLSIYCGFRSALAQVAGCGDADDLGCGHALASRWSEWLRVPVALPALILYTLLLLALFAIGAEYPWFPADRAWQLLVVLAITLLGAAGWFLALQVFVVQSVCPYCVAAHACGLFLAGFVFWYRPIECRAVHSTAALLLLGTAGTAVLIGGQLLLEPRARDMQVQGQLVVAGGKIKLDAAHYPRLGSAQARYVLVSLYDYTCPHCRVTSGYLEQARRRYGDQLAIVPLVVPWNPRCNKHVQAWNPLHEDACDYARLALAVWQASPQQFEAFHLWLLEATRTPAAARERAEELIGAVALREALAGDLLNQQLAEHVQIYAEAGGGTLPRLLYGSHSAQGQPASAEQLFQYLERDLGIRATGGGARASGPATPAW
jgi:uncharacterized membrane protein/protein-disulfide isomerase